MQMFNVRLTFDNGAGFPNSIYYIAGFSSHDGFALLSDPVGIEGFNWFKVKKYPENVAKNIVDRLPLSLGQDAANLIFVDLIPCEI